MPDISDDQFRALAEIQALGRVMKSCSSIHEAEFKQAQTALTMALNRLSSLPTVRDRSLNSVGSGGIEA
jgi:hypothetical protein